jgi:uncharacterized membrane protein
MTATAADTPTAAPPPPPPGRENTILGRLEARIIGGLVVILPVVITAWIIHMLYTAFRSYVIDPIVRGILALRGPEVAAGLPAWWRDYVAPLIALLLVLVLLYVLGLFVRSRMYRLFNALILRVPVVTPIYKATLNLFEALEQQRQAPQFKRVVLVEFPQPGMRSLGLVTNTLADKATGRRILCVVVLTGVMPPSGFTLFVPEDSVTDIDWSLNDAVQSIVTGGITAPGTIGYERAAAASRPLIVTGGEPPIRTDGAG